MDPRYAFIRSKDNFAGLPEYKEAKPVQFEDSDMHFPVQLSLLEGTVSGKKLTRHQGYLFDYISRGIRGGKVRPPGEVFNEDHNNCIKRTLDVVDSKRALGTEVKSFKSGTQVQLPNWQLGGYSYCMLNCPTRLEEIDEDNIWDIKFDFYRHTISGVEKNYSSKSIDSLIIKMASSIKNMVSLPFSVVFLTWYPKTTSFYQYRGDKRKPYTAITSPIFNMFLAEPAKALVHVGVDPKDFLIIHTRFPDGRTVNGTSITSFPISIIREKDHTISLQKFQKQYKGNAEEFLFYMKQDKAIEQGDLKDFFGQEYSGDTSFNFGANVQKEPGQENDEDKCPF